MKLLNETSSILNQKTHPCEQNLPKFFESNLLPSARATAVALRAVDDGCGLSTETHDLLNCPSEEHADWHFLLGVVCELFQWHTDKILVLGSKHSILEKWIFGNQNSISQGLTERRT